MSALSMRPIQMLAFEVKTSVHASIEFSLKRFVQLKNIFLASRRQWRPQRERVRLQIQRHQERGRPAIHATIFSASEKSQERTPLLRYVVTDCTAKHWILGFQCVENRTLGHFPCHVDLHFVADSCQIAQCMGASPDHDNVCTSTERTAGRSRTIVSRNRPHQGKHRPGRR